MGIDAQVTLLDVNPNRLAYIEDIFGASVTTLYSTEANIRKCLATADLVIGSGIDSWPDPHRSWSEDNTSN